MKKLIVTPNVKALMRIERYLRKHGLSARMFGLVAMGDSDFVYSLRRGREMRRVTRKAVEAFLKENSTEDKINVKFAKK